jgi:hypothetical protein
MPIKPKKFLSETIVLIVFMAIVQVLMLSLNIKIQSYMVTNLSNMIIALGGILIALIFSTDLSRILHEELFDRISADRNRILIKLSIYFIIAILIQITELANDIALPINLTILIFILSNSYNFLLLKTSLEKTLQQEKIGRSTKTRQINR